MTCRYIYEHSTWIQGNHLTLPGNRCESPTFRAGLCHAHCHLQHRLQAEASQAETLRILRLRGHKFAHCLRG